MSGAHAKPLSRRQRRRRERVGKRTAAAVFLTMIAAASACALTLPGIPVASGMGTPSPVARIAMSAAGRSHERTDLLADNVRAVSVDTTGTWRLDDDHIDPDALTTPAPDMATTPTSDPSPADTRPRASDQTVTLLNDTTPADTMHASRPTDTGDTGDAYPWGQCTWWAYERRHQLGLPAGSHFGNAAQWAASATALGYTVDTTPTVGAIVVFQPGQAGAHPLYGHVAIVEQVHDDGSVTISESNVQGVGVISNRTLTDAGRFAYIH